MNQTSNPQLAAALHKVESIHHIHGQQCLCGFQSAVSRDRTKHLMEVTLDAVAEYSKPSTVTTEQEVDALPVGSIVLDSDGFTARRFPGGWRTTVVEPDGSAWLSGCMEDPDLPAVVLHVGAAK